MSPAREQQRRKRQRSSREPSGPLPTPQSGGLRRGGVGHAADSPDGVDGQLFERPQVGRHPADAHEGLVEIVGQAFGPKGRGVV